MLICCITQLQTIFNFFADLIEQSEKSKISKVISRIRIFFKVILSGQKGRRAIVYCIWYYPVNTDQLLVYTSHVG